MQVSQLFAIYPEYRLGDHPEVEVHKLTFDSRNIEPNDVFIAVRGQNFDGHSVLKEVVENKPAALVVEDIQSVPEDFVGAVVVVSNTREALARLAHRFYGEPSHDLFCVGVTGTNGKTSVTYMIEKILTDFGWPTGVMGTVDHHLGGRTWPTNLTTPDPITITRRLVEMQAVGARAIVMEVSSHALSQFRAHGIAFDVGVFTNLTRDHLDYHSSMEDYFASKEILFSSLLGNSHKGSRAAVVNVDDMWGAQIQVSGGSKRVGYGKAAHHLKLSLQRMDFSGTRFQLSVHDEEYNGFIPVPGDYSVYNACAAIGACMHAGVSIASCLKSLESFDGVPGRLQRVENKSAGYAFVDYAHTDDALRSVLNVLQDIRRFSKDNHRIHLVFGCGGDRDKGKRPLMMDAAMAGADFVYVTSDNPRTEEPQKIIDDIIANTPKSLIEDKVMIEVDRKKAIEQALRNADQGDVVIVAGKGHEDYQIIGTEKHHFSDQEVIEEFSG
tara:strand:+ start:135497 stop:136984 length:1488 start_codon:yes stop_codon:yes gene_type:complete